MEILSLGIAAKWLVIPRIKDDFLHPVVISTAGNKLAIYTNAFVQPTNIEEDSIVGYIAVTGIGFRRGIENEGDTEFGKKFKKALSKPFQKIKII